VGDVKELLRLEEGDLERVVSVHACLHQGMVEFGEKLGEGIRRPLYASTRPAEQGQAVRGQVDWSATVARRSLVGGDPSRFVVRSARRVFDIPENRALVWLLDRIRARIGRAASGKSEKADAWVGGINKLKAQVKAARQAEWLRGVEPELPTQSTIKRLRAARVAFYRDHLAGALSTMLSLEDPSDRVLVELLCERYFEPAQDWLLFEVCVALRLARGFARSSGRPRKGRLMSGTGGAPYARYAYADGSEVSLILQTWPAAAGSSALAEATQRHKLASASSRPDLFIVRTGPEPDVAVLELKASYRPTYLREGLVRLLGYLAECPSAWTRQPSGWLVAPASEVFEDADAADGTIWIVSADRVAEAAVARFAPAAESG